VLLVDEMLHQQLGVSGIRRAAVAAISVVILGLPGETDLPAELTGGEVGPIFLAYPAGPRQLFASLKAAYRKAASSAQ